MNPKRSLQQLRGSVGAAAFELFVNRELKWIYRPVHQENDFGIDGYIDVIESNKVTGASLAVQIKCGLSYMSKKSHGGMRYEGEIKHLNYYCNMRQPVLLIVLDENGENGRWIQFQLEKTLPSNSPDKWWIEIAQANTLTSTVAPIWKEIAGPTFDMTAAFEAEWANYKLNSWSTNLIVAIRKDGVMACDTGPIFSWQSKLLKTREMMLAKRARVEFWFEGWDEDDRELWDIPEIRSFYNKTIADGFPWIYWLQPNELWVGYRLLFACGLNIATKKFGDKVLVEATGEEALTEWMSANFDSLNVFTETNGISLEINKECSDNLTRFMKAELFKINR